MLYAILAAQSCVRINHIRIPLWKCYNRAHMRLHKCLAALLAALLLVGCAGLGADSTPNPGPESTPTFSPTTIPATSTPSPNGNLVLWLVPRFAPSTDTAAGALLLARLQAFEANHPGLIITTRIKQESGSGGLVETLQAAAIAAPATLPDIVVLNVEMLNQAAGDGLILPLDDLLTTPSAPTWYDFSLDASMVNGGRYGMPFAADCDVLSYSLAAYPAAPRAWDDLLNGPAHFLFPAADPQAVFTINLYLAAGGAITNTAGVPMLEAEPLAEVFSFYELLLTADVVPLISRQYTTAAETWAQQSGGKAVAALAPLSTFFNTYIPSLHSAAPLPAPDTAGTIFAETWSWAIVPHDPAHQALAAELLQWLSDPEFLGPWTNALNLLPPNAPTLATWPDGPKASIASRLVTSAQNRPGDEILDVLGPPIQEAVQQIFLEGATPEEAAAAVIDALPVP